MRFLGLLTTLLSLIILPNAFALKVMIDPGHGGSDAGAYRDGLKESDITLKVALHLKALLAKDKNFEALMTRERDFSMDLKERVDLAARENAELFISIHANASTDPRASGAEFYFQNQLEASEASVFMAHQENQKSLETTAIANQNMDLSAFNADLRSVFLDLLDQARIRSSFELAKSLRENWSGNRKPKSTSLKQAPFHVVSRTAIPSSLIEIGFLTNPQEFSKLKSSEYLASVAQSLYEGLSSYRKSLEANPKKL